MVLSSSNSPTEPMVLCSSSHYLPSTIEPSVLSRTVNNNNTRCSSNDKMKQGVGSAVQKCSPTNPTQSYESPYSSSLPGETNTFSPFYCNDYSYYAKPVEHNNQHSSPFLTLSFDGSVEDIDPITIPPPVPLLDSDSQTLPELAVLPPEFEQSSTSSAVIKPKKAAAKSKTSILESELSKLLDSHGGLLKSEMVPKLIQLMEKETNLEGQSLLLSVLLSSRAMFLQKFVDLNGLNICNSWLENKRLTAFVLKVLLKLPVGYDALKSNGKIGKSVRKLSNSTDKKINGPAKQLLSQWKQTVERATGSKRKPDSKLTDTRPTKKPKLIVSHSDAFGSTTTAAPKQIVKRKVTEPRNKGTKILVLEGSTPNIPVSRPAFEEAPLSADDIKRQKLQRKALEQQKLKSKPTIPNSSAPLEQQSSISSTSNIIKNESKSPNDSLLFHYSVNHQNIRGSNEKISNNVQMDTTSHDLSTTCTENITNLNSTDTLGENPVESVNRFTPDQIPMKSKPKKRVSWAPIAKLVSVKKFPRDKTLRWDKKPFPSQSNQPQTNLESLLPVEKVLPRDPLIVTMKPSLQWVSPPAIQIPDDFRIAQGEESKQAAIQKQRVSNVLSALFVDGNIPPTPLECDDIDSGYDQYTITQIPLDDLTKTEDQTTTVNSYHSPQSSMTQMPQNSYPISSTPSYHNQPSVNSQEYRELLNSLYNSNIDPILLQSLVKNPTPQIINQVINWLYTQKQPTSWTQTPVHSSVGYGSHQFNYQHNYNTPNYSHSHYPPSGSQRHPVSSSTNYYYPPGRNHY